jgi:hypothetical protein
MGGTASVQLQQLGIELYRAHSCWAFKVPQQYEQMSGMPDAILMP